jgi:hypothetical protein
MHQQARPVDGVCCNKKVRSMPRQIPAAVLTPVVGLLKLYRPGLTETALVQALDHCTVGDQPAPL